MAKSSPQPDRRLTTSAARREGGASAKEAPSSREPGLLLFRPTRDGAMEWITLNQLETIMAKAKKGKTGGKGKKGC